MTVNIEKMRADMEAQNKQLALETRKFVVSLVVAFAVAISAAAAIAAVVTNYLTRLAHP